ncbi:hypothetical protein HU200_020762 [Digitaria exilis]|uniref:F-box domain-containing protein n=1 Tax=Digitaria exilis TaxID=1010633 RepID=A0A835F0R4_9POAL|nr:hypothetical protein HU200_020762 [Digitaria exilis]
MAKTKRQAKRKTKSKQSSSSKKELQQKQAAAEQRHGDLISELPDDILSLVHHKYAVRASATCRRWKDMYLQAPDVCLYVVSRCTAAAAAAQSMERALRRRRSPVRRLRVVYSADVAAERECMARLVGLAGAAALEVHAACADDELPEGGAGDWSLELPPGTAELTLLMTGFAIRLPTIHGPGVGSLRSFTLEAPLARAPNDRVLVRVPAGAKAAGADVARVLGLREARALMRSILAGLYPGLRHIGVALKQLVRDASELDEEQKLLCSISIEDDEIFN